RLSFAMNIVLITPWARVAARLDRAITAAWPAAKRRAVFAVGATRPGGRVEAREFGASMADSAAADRVTPWRTRRRRKRFRGGASRVATVPLGKPSRRAA